MFRDERAHQRLDEIEEKMREHREEHRIFEASLRENTELTKSIEANTKELVVLFKGASSVRTFFVWASPIVAFFGGAWAVVNWILGRH